MLDRVGLANRAGHHDSAPARVCAELRIEFVRIKQDADTLLPHHVSGVDLLRVLPQGSVKQATSCSGRGLAARREALRKSPVGSWRRQTKQQHRGNFIPPFLIELHLQLDVRELAHI